MGCPHVDVELAYAIAPLLNLARMAFESFAHVPVTEELLRHVWEGEQDSTKGGHRYGLGRLFKTEFPHSWSREHVRSAILETLSRPQFINRQSRFILCDREIENVIVRVVIAEFISHQHIHSVYPVCGEGVFRNDRTGRVALPLDFYIWKE